MRKTLMVLFLPLGLAACTVTTQTGVQPRPQTTVVTAKAPPSSNLGEYTLPGGASGVKVKSNKVEFRLSGQDAEDVYNHYDRQLREQGWVRSSVERKPNRVEARYRAGNRSLKLEVKQEGNSGKFEVELDS